MFGKKNKKDSPEQKQPETNPEIEKGIHVMPDRFYVPQKKRNLGPIIIIVVGLVIIGGLVAAAFYLNASLQKMKQPAANQNTNQDVDANTNTEPAVNQNVNTNTNTNTNADTNVNTNTDVSTTTDTNVNVNTNTDTNTNINTNTNASQGDVPQPLPLSIDKDHDQLSEAEETLYGTDPVLRDTDNDTYPDGSELLSGYDPTKPNASLADSGLFSDYDNSVYSIVYPTKWEVQQQGSDQSEVLFISDSGEFIEVLILPNSQGLPLVSWYMEQFPQIDRKYIYQSKVGDNLAIRHPDNQSYYLISPDNTQIYMITYNVGTRERLSFITTLTIMVKSFKLK